MNTKEWIVRGRSLEVVEGRQLEMQSHGINA
jgi:hypothetical protein